MAAKNCPVLGELVPAENDHLKTRLVRFSDVYCMSKCTTYLDSANIKREIIASYPIHSKSAYILYKKFVNRITNSTA
jgi:hypothetical protein